MLTADLNKYLFNSLISEFKQKNKNLMQNLKLIYRAQTNCLHACILTPYPFSPKILKIFFEVRVPGQSLKNQLELSLKNSQYVIRLG